MTGSARAPAAGWPRRERHLPSPSPRDAGRGEGEGGRAPALRRLALAALCGLAAACASAGRPAAVAADPAAAERRRLARDFGVEVQWVRSIAANRMLEFRFRVLDPEKAAPLLLRKNKARLVDQRSGRELDVPSPPKIGPLRTTTLAPEADRSYFALFGNGAGVGPGSLVTVVIGDFRAPDLVVQ